MSSIIETLFQISYHTCFTKRFYYFIRVLMEMANNGRIVIN